MLCSYTLQNQNLRTDECHRFLASSCVTVSLVRESLTHFLKSRIGHWFLISSNDRSR